MDIECSYGKILFFLNLFLILHIELKLIDMILVHYL